MNIKGSLIWCFEMMPARWRSNSSWSIRDRDAVFDRSVDSHREIHAKNVQEKTYWKGKIFGQRFGKQFGK